VFWGNSRDGENLSPWRINPDGRYASTTYPNGAVIFCDERASYWTRRASTWLSFAFAYLDLMFPLLIESINEISSQWIHEVRRRRRRSNKTRRCMVS
jgi:heme exporter protein D